MGPWKLGGFYVEVNYAPDEGTTYGLLNGERSCYDNNPMVPVLIVEKKAIPFCTSQITTNCMSSASYSVDGNGNTHMIAGTACGDSPNSGATVIRMDGKQTWDSEHDNMGNPTNDPNYGWVSAGLDTWTQSEILGGYCHNQCRSNTTTSQSCSDPEPWSEWLTEDNGSGVMAAGSGTSSCETTTTTTFDVSYCNISVDGGVDKRFYKDFSSRLVNTDISQNSHVNDLNKEALNFLTDIPVANNDADADYAVCVWAGVIKEADFKPRFNRVSSSNKPYVLSEPRGWVYEYKASSTSTQISPLMRRDNVAYTNSPIYLPGGDLYGHRYGYKLLNKYQPQLANCR